jgi:general secretion pathway protein D
MVGLLYPSTTRAVLPLCRPLRHWLLFGAIALSGLTAPAADNVHTLYEKGRDAEARQDYIAAYNYYHAAYEQSPKDITYRACFQRARFYAATAYVHRGENEQQAGQLLEALGDYQRALSVDPSSFIAQQLLNRVSLELRKGRENKDRTTSAAETSNESLGGPVELKAFAATPITLNLTEDAKVVFQSLASLAGINVLFDADFALRRIHVDLSGVTLQEALKVTAMQSRAFWRPVTPNTIFVASDTPAKRKELEQSVVRTFYLSSLTQPNELQDVVNILRTLLDTQRLQQFPAQHAIVMRGTPAQIVMADKLIKDLDKAQPEVVVDVIIMQVSRDKLKDVGINPPTSVSANLQNSSTSTSSSSSNSTTSSSSSTSSSTSGSISLNTLGNLNATNFQLTISEATASFLFTDSNSKILQQPQLRSIDGQKASLKLGERVPVATGSFTSGTTSASALVNTQFNYIDVGVNLDITPLVLNVDDVMLKMAIDISAVDSYQNIGGINEPVIGQRKIEHQVQLKNGEVSLIGGLLEEDEIRNLSGYPGLSGIPFLRYLFSENKKELKDNELVFVVIPHVVRIREIERANTRTIDVGTASSIQVHNSAQDGTQAQQEGDHSPVQH